MYGHQLLENTIQSTESKLMSQESHMSQRLQEYRKTPNKRPPPINAPPYTLDPMFGCFLTFLAISSLKIVRFSFRKKLLEEEYILFKSTMPANAHGRLLGVLWYPSLVSGVSCHRCLRCLRGRRHICLHACPLHDT